MSDKKCFLFINDKYHKEIEEWQNNWPVVRLLTELSDPYPGDPDSYKKCVTHLDIDASALPPQKTYVKALSFRMGDEPHTAVELLGFFGCTLVGSSIGSSSYTTRYEYRRSTGPEDNEEDCDACLS